MGSGYNQGVHKDGPNNLVVEPNGTIKRSVQRFYNDGMRVGAGAGFTLAGNTMAALLPASQSASKLLVPISGLKPGDKITGFTVHAQVESAGGTVTIDADLRKITNAAADPVDASVGAITQVSVTADTAVAANKAALAETVVAGVSYYVLLTATTAASTDIQVLGVAVAIDEI